MAPRTYVHPSSGATVVDVKCPKHAKVRGHVAAGELGKATCGAILKSHKETGPEEIDNGKKVRPTRTVVDEECKEILVAVDDPKDAKADKAAAKDESDKQAKRAKESGKASKGSKGAKGAKGVEKHPQAV